MYYIYIIMSAVCQSSDVCLVVDIPPYLEKPCMCFRFFKLPRYIYIYIYIDIYIVIYIVIYIIYLYAPGFSPDGPVWLYSLSSIEQLFGATLKSVIKQYKQLGHRWPNVVGSFILVELIPWRLCPVLHCTVNKREYN